mgnify:CR=1 FL=1
MGDAQARRLTLAQDYPPLVSRAHAATAGAPRALVVAALGERSEGVTRVLFCARLLWRACLYACYNGSLSMAEAI